MTAGAARAPSVRRAVLQFALAGLAALAVVLVGTLLVLRELGRREALRDAREFAVLAGLGVVEPWLTDELVAGDEADLGRVDRLVQERVLGERVVRVKIWTADGRIVYSDEPRLLGARHRLGEDERAALRTGAAEAELSDLDRPENRFERGQGELYEVYTRVRTPDGTPLLFETYQRASALVASGRDVWLPFAVPLLVGLLLLWLVQVPLAWRLARRLRRAQDEREALLVRAVEASANERRRIAADLHDGPVQDLAGVSYSLDAAARSAPELADTLRGSAATTRAALRQLRSLLVEIHPPNLRSAGLEAALSDLLAPLAAAGAETHLDVEDGLALEADAERLVFRAAGEALRNAQRHGRPSSVRVRVAGENGNVRLEVSDDGIGFAPAERGRRRAEGHLGLALLEDLADGAGGRLDVRSAPGEGTTVVLEVPRA